jgi:putative selenium metabolism protein SsnA
MLITNARVITLMPENRILEKQAILIKDGVIAEIDSNVEMNSKYPAEERLDANGQYVMPGNICAHTHFYGAFSRGLGIPGAAPADFPEILDKLWWRLDKALDSEAVYYSAMVCLIEAIKHGTTTLIDHHASPMAIEGSLDEIAKAVLQTGLRASLCYEVTDRDGEEKASEGIRENVRFNRKVLSTPEWRGRLGSLFGLHASLTLSDKTLALCRAAADENTGFHIHVAEHPVDEYDSVRKSGTRVVDRLEQAGLLGPKSIAVHAVHVDTREINILAQTGTWVSHQPRSNMNNAVGLPMVESMLRQGMKVCLGNDGFSNAMWEEWKAAYLSHKLLHRDPRRMPGDQLAQMAWGNNRDLASAMLDGLKVGVIEPQAVADLIFVDYHPFTEFTPGNLPWHILFGFHESMITTTIVGGRILMKDHRLVSIDEEEIAAKALEASQKVWARYRNLFV